MISDHDCLKLSAKTWGRLYKNVVKVITIVSVKVDQSESRILELTTILLRNG